MKASTICPCCSTPLLRHLDRRHEYWFCRHCWQEMPDLDNSQHQTHRLSKNVRLSSDLPSLNRPLLVT